MELQIYSSIFPFDSIQKESQLGSFQVIFDREHQEFNFLLLLFNVIAYWSSNNTAMQLI